MSYQGWNSHVERVCHRMKWYKIDCLFFVVKELQDHIDKAYVSGFDPYDINYTSGSLSVNFLQLQKHIHRQLRKYLVLSPASCKTRFPEDTYFICGHMGVWPRLLGDLRILTSVLAHPKLINKHRYPEIDSIGAAEQQLIECCDAILQSIVLKKSVVDRTTFEKSYKLMWTSTEQSKNDPVKFTRTTATSSSFVATRAEGKEEEKPVVVPTTTASSSSPPATTRESNPSSFNDGEEYTSGTSWCNEENNAKERDYEGCFFEQLYDPPVDYSATETGIQNNNPQEQQQQQSGDIHCYNSFSENWERAKREQRLDNHYQQLQQQRRANNNKAAESQKMNNKSHKACHHRHLSNKPFQHFLYCTLPSCKNELVASIQKVAKIIKQSEENLFTDSSNAKKRHEGNKKEEEEKLKASLEVQYHYNNTLRKLEGVPMIEEDNIPPRHFNVGPRIQKERLNAYLSTIEEEKEQKEDNKNKENKEKETGESSSSRKKEKKRKLSFPQPQYKTTIFHPPGGKVPSLIINGDDLTTVHPCYRNGYTRPSTSKKAFRL